MGQIERSFAGVLWLLFAIYVVLTGFAIEANSSSPLGGMMVMLSLLPALVGTLLTFLPLLEASDE